MKSKKVMPVVSGLFYQDEINVGSNLTGHWRLGMKAEYPIEWRPATPQYILASLREEWRQCALTEGEQPDEVERRLPTFATTVHQWREAMELLGCVTTATTLTPGLAHNAARLGQAISAVPMKMTRNGCTRSRLSENPPGQKEESPLVNR